MSTPLSDDNLQPYVNEISRTGGTIQVTVDAGGAASGMINFSMTALARLSQAGIDPSTFCWAILVGEHINWTLEGSKRFYEALNKTTVRKGYHNILWFGFGHKSPITVLKVTESSSRFAAMCACLTEVYSTHMAAQIMLAFSKAISENMRQPRPPIPSLLQMHLIMEKCVGIFSATTFPLRAEKFMSFDDEKVIGQHAWPKGVGKARYSRGVSKPEDIAQALYGLTQLSRGTLHHLSLAGVADAGLVAAIGDWLFDLKFAIYSKDGQNEDGLKFRNVEEGSEPQLTVIYTRQEPSTSLTQRGRSVHLPDATLLFKSHAQSKPSQDRVLGGRVHWGQAFEGTFGQDFRKLLKVPVLFGTAMGSAARIFSAFVYADENLPEKWLRQNTIYFPDSFGRDFVDFAQKRFPELKVKQLRTHMETAVHTKTYGEAEAAFENSMDGLAKCCGCKVCSPHTGSNNKGDNSGIPAQQYCMVAIAATAIRLVRILSGISPIDGLHPMRAGLEYIYEITRTRIWRLKRQGGETVSPTICSIIEGAVPDLNWTEISLLRFSHHIFGGQTFHDELDDPGSSATVFEGICCYLDILRDPVQDDPIGLSRVNVLPGHIQWEGRLFHKLGEMSTDLLNAKSPPQSRPKQCIPDLIVKTVKQCFGGELKLILTENISRDGRAFLEVDYEVINKSGERRRLGPAKTARNICRGSGLVTCRNDGCDLSQAIANDLAIKLAQQDSTTPLSRVIINNNNVTIFDGGHVALLFAAFGCWEPLIQRGECIACCVRTGCRNGWDNFAIARTRISRSASTMHFPQLECYIDAVPLRKE